MMVKKGVYTSQHRGTRRPITYVGPMVSGIPHTTVHRLVCITQSTQIDEDMVHIDARAE